MKAFTVAAVQIAPLPGPLTAESVKGNLAKAAGLFNAPASQVARLAQALADKRAAEGGAAESAAPAEPAAAAAE